MSDALHPVTATRAGARPGPAPSPPAARVPAGSPSPERLAAVGVCAMSLEDYTRVVQARAEFVDFLLAPAGGELAAAA